MNKKYYVSVTKNIKKMQNSDMTKEWLDDFYASGHNVDTVIMVYEGEVWQTLLSYEDYVWIDEHDCLGWYLKCSNNKIICGPEWTEKEIQSYVEKSIIQPQYLLCSFNEDEKTQFWKNVNLYFWTEEYSKIKNILRGKGVATYAVNIPDEHQVIKSQKHDCTYMPNIFVLSPWMRRGLVRTELLPVEKVTEREEEYKAGKFESKNYREFYTGKNRKTIYLYGPCIINASENVEGEDLASVLYEFVKDEYNLIAISDEHTEVDFKKSILAQDIKANDIVLLIYSSLINADLDLTYLYNTYFGDKWLYQDEPIHTTVTGNRLLAEVLSEKVIQPQLQTVDETKSDVVIYHGEKQHTYEYEQELFKYINKIKRRDIPEDKTVGAIVMNCNPFTLGHRYLVEYAARNVDYLYVFCVEEDLAEIPFYDRFFLIHDGIKDLENVFLVPSGKFMASIDTVEAYFFKDHIKEEINAVDDLYNFSKYVAKELNIVKRFVGQEPLDVVTAGYNQQLKETLPQYGIEVVEIPRKELEDHTVVSASRVRRFLLEKNWDEIRRLVPKTTFEYLQKNVGFIIRRIQEKKKTAETKMVKGMAETAMEKLLETINQEDYIVIYGLGHDAEQILKRVSDKRKEILQYCDKRANSEAMYYNGKRVIRPKELADKYVNYKIVITSTQYSKEIYKELCELGIDMTRCYFNVVYA